MSKFPWWAILIVIVVLLIIYFLIPWKKIAKKRKSKNEIVNKAKFVDKKENNQIIQNTCSNKPLFGLYNWFGNKEALRIRRLVYVEEQLDSCEFCREFENKVLSLEEYDKNYLTMKEAISKGYHHIGCKHKDIDFFPKKTKIPCKLYTLEEQINQHKIILQWYKLENDMRNLLYHYENISSDEEIKEKIEIKSQEINNFCVLHNLKRNHKRENPNISDYKKFSNF